MLTGPAPVAAADADGWLEGLLAGRELLDELQLFLKIAIFGCVAQAERTPGTVTVQLWHPPRDQALAGPKHK